MDFTHLLLSEPVYFLIYTGSLIFKQSPTGSRKLLDRFTQPLLVQKTKSSWYWNNRPESQQLKSSHMCRTVTQLKNWWPSFNWRASERTMANIAKEMKPYWCRWLFYERFVKNCPMSCDKSPFDLELACQMNIGKNCFYFSAKLYVCYKFIISLEAWAMHGNRWNRSRSAPQLEVFVWDLKFNPHF